ncbi:MAG: YdcF family protein [Pseudomonadota bacterium]
MDGETLLALKAFATAAILPPGCFLLVFLAAGAAWATGWRRIAAATATLGAGLAWALATPIVADGFTRLATAGVVHLPADAAPPDADAIIVLGGGVAYDAPEYGRDAVADASMARAHYAATLVRRTGLPLMVTAAGPIRPGGLGEAGTMTVFLQELGTPPRWVDASPLNTADSARSVRRLLPDAESILLVTSLIHMRRAAGLFRTAGFTVIEAPTGGGRSPDRWWRALLPGSGSYRATAEAGNELLGRTGYAVSGWLTPSDTTRRPEERDGLRQTQ